MDKGVGLDERVWIELMMILVLAHKDKGSCDGAGFLASSCRIPVVWLLHAREATNASSFATTAGLLTLVGRGGAIWSRTIECATLHVYVQRVPKRRGCTLVDREGDICGCCTYGGYAVDVRSLCVRMTVVPSARKICTTSANSARWRSRS